MSSERIVVVRGVRYVGFMPFSEVCMHMRIAGKAMAFELKGDSVQLFDAFGNPFSSSILPGEAGLYRIQGGDGYYYYPKGAFGQYEGTEGQDRKSYSDTQDRRSKELLRHPRSKALQGEMSKKRKKRKRGVAPLASLEKNPWFPEGNDKLDPEGLLLGPLHAPPGVPYFKLVVEHPDLTVGDIPITFGPIFERLGKGYAWRFVPSGMAENYAEGMTQWLGMWLIEGGRRVSVWAHRNKTICWDEVVAFPS